MNFQEYNNEAEQDFELRKENLDEQLYLIPNLHSKWMRYFYTEKSKLIDWEKSLLDMYKTKYYYYLNDYDHVVEAKHVEWHIKSDDEYSKKLRSVNKQKNLVDYVQSMVKKANTLSFDIKNLIEWKKLMMGVV